MFLVSNSAMMKAAMTSGIMGVFPSLNFREEGELSAVIDDLKVFKNSGSTTGNFGVNLIVQKSNPLYKEHLAICVEKQVPFFITSLGSPEEVIKKAHAYGAKVYCDVINIKHAQKCYDLNCDGFIAVGQGAGGHAGPHPLQVLVPALNEKFPDTPVIAAGGISTGKSILSMLVLGAAGVSIGTRFIASKESPVNEAYKNSIVTSGMDDIVMTTKISGTPCSILNTEYAKKIGYEQNILEKWLSDNPKTKKWFKMLVQLRGMKKLEKSAFGASYKTLWCAGKSVEFVDDILSCSEIIERMKAETEEARARLANRN